jgi:hypothetical protein
MESIYENIHHQSHGNSLNSRFPNSSLEAWREAEGDIFLKSRSTLEDRDDCQITTSDNLQTLFHICALL